MSPDPSPSEDVPRELCRAKIAPPIEMASSPSQPAARSSQPDSPVSPGRRFYVVVRADLDAGLAAAQACHVARKFTRHFRDIPVEEDENLLVLAAKDERHLQELLERAGPLGPCSAFHEPDLAGSLTAIALGGDLLGGRAVQRLVSQLPKALRTPSPAAGSDGWLVKCTLRTEAA